jgi:hypothetical protein
MGEPFEKWGGEKGENVKERAKKRRETRKIEVKRVKHAKGANVKAEKGYTRTIHILALHGKRKNIVLGGEGG